MDCQPGASRLSLQSAQQGAKLDMLAEDGNMSTVLRAAQGAIVVKAGNHINESSGQDLVEHSNRNRLLHAGRHYRMRVRGNMRLQAAGGADFNAVEHMSFKAAKNIIFKAATRMLLYGKQRLQIKAHHGKIQINAQRGDMVCTAERGIRLIGCGQGDIILLQGNSQLRITAAGDINIRSRNLCMTAKQGIYIQGAVHYHAATDGS